MKRVIYVLTSLAHKRAFEPFVPRRGMEQLIVGPHPNSTTSIVPEDYSDFKIKNIKHFNTHMDIQALVDSFGPDIYVQSDVSPIHNRIVRKKECKRVFVHHGMAGNHVISIAKKLGSDLSVWKGMDLYCGASENFGKWIKHVAKVDDSKILLNALPQLDILHDPNYYNSYRQKVLANTKHPNAKKVLLYVGFCCKDRYDFDMHNEDYFSTVIELEKIARENNWLIMVKPRQTFSVMLKFLRSHKWGKKYISRYSAIQDSKHLHFITTTGHIYRYFFADAIIINGTSTVEIEACAINKPLVIVRTHPGLGSYDPYDTVKDLACTYVDDIQHLWHGIDGVFKDNWTKNQNLLINKMGITFDGNMHKRIQDRLARM